MPSGNSFYTRKQSWRRVQWPLIKKPTSRCEFTSNSTLLRDHITSLCSMSVTDAENGSNFGYTTSEELRSESDVKFPNLPSTPGYSVKKRPGCVSFSEMVQVVLVPTRVEYISCGAGRDVWWSGSELREFKTDAQYEAVSALKFYECDVYSTIRAMYQPGFAEWDLVQDIDTVSEEDMFTEGSSSMYDSLNSSSSVCEYLSKSESMVNTVNGTVLSVCAHRSNRLAIGAAVFERRFGPMHVKGYSYLLMEQPPDALQRYQCAVCYHTRNTVRAYTQYCFCSSSEFMTTT